MRAIASSIVVIIVVVECFPAPLSTPPAPLLKPSRLGNVVCFEDGKVRAQCRHPASVKWIRRGSTSQRRRYRRLRRRGHRRGRFGSSVRPLRRRRFDAANAAGAASDATGAVPPTGFVALPASSVVPPNRQRCRHAGVNSDAAPFGFGEACTDCRFRI